MKGYENFKLAAYFPAPDIVKMSMKEIEEAIGWYRRYSPLDKVYIETYRNGVFLERETVLEVKELFGKAGIESAGGITYTLTDEDYPWPRIMKSFCYTNRETREKVKDIAVFTADFFDEVILDDFYFTDCSCQECIDAKGDRSWKDFRLSLMAEVSKNLVVKPMKEVNSQVKVIIKYPNWNESFPHVGYNTEAQPDIFDGVYTGTETRDPMFSQQHLPRYASYSLMRWMDDCSRGNNGGGWFDWIDCIYNIGSFLEQARLTALAKPPELTLFNFKALYGSLFIPPLGVDLQCMDKNIEHLGKPAGIPFYHPHHGTGDQHSYDYLGMAGFPLAPTPDFPSDPQDVPLLFCGGSSSDEDSVKRIVEYASKGGRVIITANLAEKTKGLGGALSSIYGNEQILADGWSSHARGCAYEHSGRLYEPVLFNKIEIHTNDSFPLSVVRQGNFNTPLLILDHYGKGDIMTLNIPGNPSWLSQLPEQLLNALRDLIFKDEVRLEGPGDISLFLYDNNTLVLHSFRRENSTVLVRGIHTIKPLNDSPMPDDKGCLLLPPGGCAFYRYE